jgi:hypothetical protein
MRPPAATIFSIRQLLGRPLPGAYQARFDKRLGRDFGALGKTAQVIERHDLGFHAKRIREPPLGQTTGHWHLTALELRLAAARAVVARTRLDAFVSLA